LIRNIHKVDKIPKKLTHRSAYFFCCCSRSNEKAKIYRKTKNLSQDAQQFCTLNELLKNVCLFVLIQHTKSAKKDAFFQFFEYYTCL